MPQLSADTQTTQAISSRARAGLIRLPDIMALTSMSRSWIYREARAGRFPAPVRLPATSSAVWWKSDVLDWLADLELEQHARANESEDEE